MQSYDSVKTRFHFSLPDDYLRFWRAGILLNDPAIGIKLSRHSWLSPDEIASCDWPEYKIPQLIPCAQTPGRDHFCWYAEKTHSNWIADCPRDSDFAEGIAPHFEGFVFRSLIEEFADSWLTTDLVEVAMLFRRYARRASAELRPNWSEILTRFAARSPTLNQWQRPQVISQAEAADAIRRELAFSLFRKEFRQNMI